jgi:hypothetical protein
MEVVMKAILVGAVVALLIGLAFAAPFIVVLAAMVTPLIVLAIFAGWESSHRSSAGADVHRTPIGEWKAVTRSRPQ